MNQDWLPLGSIEPIEVFAVDSSGSPITGMTNLYAAVRRASDGLWLDFGDMTFKAALWSARLINMVEFDPTLSPGFYRFTFNTATFASPDDYVIVINQTPATVFPRQVVAELRVGGVPDDCTLARKKLTNREVLSTTTLTTYNDDGSVLMTAAVADRTGGPITLESGAPASRTKGV